MLARVSLFCPSRLQSTFSPCRLRLVPLVAALIIPIYVDTSFMMLGAIGRKLGKANKTKPTEKDVGWAR